MVSSFRGLLAAAVFATGGVFATTPPSAAESATPFAAFALASRHVGADRKYNERNPGLGLGLAWEGDRPGTRFAVEAGGYLNSHAEYSPYLKVTISREIARLGQSGPGIRLGAFAGAARYGGRGEAFRRMGYPAVRDWVPIAGAEASVVFGGGAEMALGFLPAPGIADVLATVQIRVPLTNPRDRP